ncbi:restriction endonuclease subunit S [Bifidobacterium bifidum]|uniref:restriction endonuclease subunit S n=1 Tax=Bifidobacterium bifidum TaxID=1681 RepID=UPI004029A5FE
MTEQAKVPAIRFAGFTDPWEQRKFSDIVDVCSGKDYKHLEEGPIPVYGTGGFMTSVDEALSYDRDAVGIGRKGTIDKPYLLKAPFWTVDTLFYAIPKSDMDLEFVHCSFLNVDWKSKDESTGLPSLSKEAINETIALVPSFNEQSRLGDFFYNLDNLITLHQRKYDKLVIFKKSMLEKMFPKDGESVPEIRFAGFTDPWEQRKFSDIVDVCSGKDYKHLEEGPIPVYGTGGFMTSVDEALSYDRDAVGIGRKGTIDKPYLLKAPFWTVDTLFYAIPKSDMDLEFVHCSFLNVDWKSKDESTGLPSLSKEAINETIALVPSFNEQSRLGDFFYNLDNLITLHQRKLELLQNIKKSLLDKMFV